MNCLRPPAQCLIKGESFSHLSSQGKEFGIHRYVWCLLYIFLYLFFMRFNEFPNIFSTKDLCVTNRCWLLLLLLQLLKLILLSHFSIWWFLLFIKIWILNYTCISTINPPWSNYFTIFYITRFNELIVCLGYFYAVDEIVSLFFPVTFLSLFFSCNQGYDGLIAECFFYYYWMILCKIDTILS